MKVIIDQKGCIECGACEDNCSDVFVIEDNGKAAVVKEFRTNGPSVGEVKEDFRTCAEEAAEECPVDVIQVK